QQTPAYIEATSLMPGWSNVNFVFATVSVYTHFNGLFILPILAAASQYLTTMLTPQPQQPTAEGQPNTGNFMKWFFPLFTLYICYNYNASFALYWVAANVIAAAETFVINKFFDNKEKQEKVLGDKEAL
ncbi:MAG: YidC/Oxa1 family membrane protein insertase, partial [Christensenellaceae bacterium]|nr:YidC/Oxa1 family membrane protein insertase [Christensenellaceae bacterium]